MDAWVLNLEHEPERWLGMCDRFAGSGWQLRRFAATPDTGLAGEWSGRLVADVSRRQAIIATYQRLLAMLERSDEPGWVVLQDDVVPRRLPDPPESSLLHIYGGWRVRYLKHDRAGVWRPIEGSWHLADVRRPTHVCPQAFYLHRDLLPQLRDVWSDTTRQVCETWIPLLRNFATFEKEPTIEAPPA